MKKMHGDAAQVKKMHAADKGKKMRAADEAAGKIIKNRGKGGNARKRLGKDGKNLFRGRRRKEGGARATCRGADR